MDDDRFRCLSNPDLADIWYALSGADIRHPDCFKHLVDAVFRELESRQGSEVSKFLNERFAKFRPTDAAEDVEANLKATESCDPPQNDR
jgi:hypothetical protein